MHIGQRERKIVRAERDLSTRLGREPTDEEIAAAAELPLEQVEEVRDAARTVTSLDRPIGEEGDTALGDVLEGGSPPVDQEVEVSLSEELLRRTIEELPETERDVIRLRFGFEDDDPQPLRETGRRLGLSAERVRQIESRALNGWLCAVSSRRYARWPRAESRATVSTRRPPQVRCTAPDGPFRTATRPWPGETRARQHRAFGLCRSRPTAKWSPGANRAGRPSPSG